MIYPCQQASVASGGLWLAAYVLPLFMAVRSAGAATIDKGRILAGFLLLLIISLFVLGGPFNILGRADVAKDDAPVAGIADTILINLSQMRSQFPEPSDIFAVTGTFRNDDAVTRLVELMNRHGLPFYAQNGSFGIIGKDDVVIIKVNSQWDERGGTNSDLVKALVQAIQEHPQGFSGEVVIADNGQGQYGSTGRGGSLSYARNNAKDKTHEVKIIAVFGNASSNLTTPDNPSKIIDLTHLTIYADIRNSAGLDVGKVNLRPSSENGYSGIWNASVESDICNESQTAAAHPDASIGAFKATPLVYQKSISFN